jgi:hypothetical protein
MSNESENRIDLTQFRLVTIGIELGLTQVALREWHTGMKRERLGELIRAHEEVPKLIEELKKCYELIDWLLVVEDHFTSDGSYNNNANFVYECAVNEKYGYRIEVIDGVETVMHESEQQASD